MKHAWTGLVTALVTLAALGAAPAAQNETNWHPQSNDFDGVYVGLGVGGGLTTTADGVGKWVAGEDLRGSRKAAFSNDFGFKVRDILLTHCLLGDTGGMSAQWTPLLTYWEYDGRNPNRPDVFTNPVCSVPGLVMGSAAGRTPGRPAGHHGQPGGPGTAHGPRHGHGDPAQQTACCRPRPAAR